jgi:hypothetical protein
MVSPSAEYHSLEVRFQARLPFTKHLSLKPHSSRKDDLPAGRTLFVAGLPLTISANDLVELFSVFGNVSSLAVHPSKVGTVRSVAVCDPAVMSHVDYACMRATGGHMNCRPLTQTVSPHAQTTCILVFGEEKGCKAALSAASSHTVLELTPAEPEGPIGLKSWVTAHKVGMLTRHNLLAWFA